jgi:hypothetical protein
MLGETLLTVNTAHYPVTPAFWVNRQGICAFCETGVFCDIIPDQAVESPGDTEESNYSNQVTVKSLLRDLSILHAG